MRSWAMLLYLNPPELLHDPISQEAVGASNNQRWIRRWKAAIVTIYL